LERERLKELLIGLFEGSLGARHYAELSLYLRNLLAHASKHLGESLRRSRSSGEVPVDLFAYLLSRQPRREGEDPAEDLVRDFTLHLLGRKGAVLSAMESGRNPKGYLLTCAKNFLVDMWRKERIRSLTTQEAGEEEPKGQSGEVRQLELLELEVTFLRKVKEKDLKYVCYLMDSKRYKCLWKGKSDSSVYKDVERNRERILAILKEVAAESGADRDLWNEFVRVRLSALCEGLRLKGVRGEDAQGAA